MSTLYRRSIRCPACRTDQEQEIAESINAARSPHFREAILEGRFQRFACPTCGAELEVDDPLLYIDLVRGEVIGCFPATDEPAWPEFEQATLELWERNLGDRAPRVARELGQGSRVRTVFGLEALREKVLCFDAGLDDVALEALKLSLLPEIEGAVLHPEQRPRLLEVRQDQLVFRVPRRESSGRWTVGSLEVPRGACQEICDATEVWAEVLTSLQEGPYVDTGRLLLPGRLPDRAG